MHFYIMLWTLSSCYNPLQVQFRIMPLFDPEDSQARLVAASVFTATVEAEVLLSTGEGSTLHNSVAGWMIDTLFLARTLHHHDLTTKPSHLRLAMPTGVEMLRVPRWGGIAVCCEKFEEQEAAFEMSVCYTFQWLNTQELLKLYC